MELYAMNIREKITETFRQHLNQVDEETKKQVLRYKKKEDAVRKLYGELVIRTIIQERFKVTNKEIEIERHVYGKPYLKGRNDFHYNISHSGDWIVWAIDSKPIGIDVEKITPGCLDIAKRFFAREEVAYLLGVEEEDQDDQFFEIWTLKESYIKQIGMGVALDFKDFSMIKQYGQWRVISSKYDTELFLKHYELDPQYKLAVCTKSDDFAHEIKQVY